MIKVGDKVHWNDPAIVEYDKEDRHVLLNRVFTVDIINGDIITISDGYSEAEVFENELIKI